MTRFVALLRGINVGGNNVIKMADLRSCFEASGFENVTTFIQSGNVIFDSKKRAREEVTRRVEAILSAQFSYSASVVLRTDAEMQAVVTSAPRGFGAQPAKFRYDVLFLKPPLTAEIALESVKTTPGVDQVIGGEAVLYFSRVIAQASRSQLAKLAGQPVYKSMTIRNWNTTTKLAELAATPTQ